LRLFLDPDKLPETHPVYNMIASPNDVINRKARRIVTWIKKISNVKEYIDIKVIDSTTEMGSGSLPARGIPTRVVTLTPKTTSAENLGRALRSAKIPVFSRIEDEMVILDARTISDEENPWIKDSLQQGLELLESGVIEEKYKAVQIRKHGEIRPG